MKLVLKILALPVLFVVKVICILGNLLTNVVSYVIGLLLLVIGGSAIYCIVKALWQSLLILVVLGIATIAAVFLLVWAVMKVENIGESLGAFIRSYIHGFEADIRWHRRSETKPPAGWRPPPAPPFPAWPQPVPLPLSVPADCHDNALA